MSDKITTFPVLQPLALQSNGSFSPQGTGGGVGNNIEKKGFASQFTGDIFTSRGRFGNGTNYLDLTAEEIKSANYVSGSAGWRIAYDGTAQLNELTLTGGTLKYGKTSFTDSSNAGYHLSSNGFYFGAASDASYIKYNIATSAFTVYGVNVDYPTLTNLQSGSEIAIQGWQFDAAFSASDADTVAWTAGTIRLLDGRTFSIDAGNTGNMAAITYIYYDNSLSQTVLQTTTTNASAVGTGKILIAVAQNNSDATSKATFQVFGGKGGQMLAVDSIAANSASVNEFISNTAQIKDAIITNAKIASLDVAKLTAGTITSKTITLAVADGTGDSYIAAGKTDFTYTESGFILGIDDSDANKAKFVIGNSSWHLAWDGTTFDVHTQTATLGNWTFNETRMTTSTDNIFIGTTSGNSQDSSGFNIYLGHLSGYTATTADYNVLVGYKTNYSDNPTSTTSVGYQAGMNATGTYGNVNIGYGAGLGGGTTTRCIFIGYQANCTSGANASTGSIAIGDDINITASNQLLIGGVTSGGITDAYIGKGVTNSSPSAITLQPTGESGTNQSGVAFNIGGGKSTGNADGGAINFQISISGSSGETLNGLTTKMTIDSIAVKAINYFRIDGLEATPYGAAYATYNTINEGGMYGYLPNISPYIRSLDIFACGDQDGSLGGGMIRFLTNPGNSNTCVEAMRIDRTSSIIIGTAALATNATDGFLYISSCAGTPTGTPTAYTGRCAIVFDTTNNKLYVYDGSWIDVT